MKIKTLFKKCIYQTSENIMVYENYFYRWLTLGSEAIQTLINKKHPEKIELEYIKPIANIIQKDSGNVCILGLGGGGIIHALSDGSKFFTAVEKDEVVIHVAKHFFYLEIIANVKIINEDAFSFVKSAREKFDYLIIDIFEASTFPNHCIEEQFFSHCKRLLKPNGILFVNIANNQQHWTIFSLVRDNFQLGTLCIPIKKTSNLIVVAVNNDSALSLVSRVEQSHLFKKVVWDERWGGVVEYRT